MRASRSRIKAIVAGLALLCSFPAAIRADTVLIYTASFSVRTYGGGTSIASPRYYLLFDYTTLKTGLVFYLTSKGKKYYGVVTNFANGDFFQASVTTSATASSTFFVITKNTTVGDVGRDFLLVSANGVNKLMDLGGGHIGKDPPNATGILRSVDARQTEASSRAGTGTLTMRLVPALTMQSNVADASLSDSIKVVTDDLDSRGYTQQPTNP